MAHYELLLIKPLFWLIRPYYIEPQRYDNFNSFRIKTFRRRSEKFQATVFQKYRNRLSFSYFDPDYFIQGKRERGKEQRQPPENFREKKCF